MRIGAFTTGNLEEWSALARRLNAFRESGSSFCCAELDAIRRDFSENMSHSFGCWEEGIPAGLISCYLDREKGNADCAMLIDTSVIPYAAAAEGLLSAVRNELGKEIACTFFFPKENRDCARFLEQAGAKRQVNEYCLLLRRNAWRAHQDRIVPQPLQERDQESFAALHDSVFPAVYCSGRDILEDWGKTRFIYTIRAAEQLVAYGVLRIPGGNRATAEIIGVRDGFRGRGYGRAILNHLVMTAFSQFDAEKIDLIVDGDNERAIRLYLNTGFVIEQENNCYILQL